MSTEIKSNTIVYTSCDTETRYIVRMNGTKLTKCHDLSVAHQADTTAQVWVMKRGLSAGSRPLVICKHSLSSGEQAFNAHFRGK